MVIILQNFDKSPIIPLSWNILNPEIVEMLLYTNTVNDCRHLFSTQDEADTRMILHASNYNTKFREMEKEKLNRPLLILQTYDTYQRVVGADGEH